MNAAPQKDAGQQYVTQQTLEKFGEKLMEKFDQKLKDWSQRGRGQRRYNVARDKCYLCYEKGHFIANCPKNVQSNDTTVKKHVCWPRHGPSQSV